MKFFLENPLEIRRKQIQFSIFLIKSVRASTLDMNSGQLNENLKTCLMGNGHFSTPLRQTVRSKFVKFL